MNYKTILSVHVYKEENLYFEEFVTPLNYKFVSAFEIALPNVQFIDDREKITFRSNIKVAFCVEYSCRFQVK